MEKPVLFFSKNCPHSQTLWKYMSENRLLDSFTKISIDNNPNIPPSVTSVPTIYVKGRPLITGQGVMMYVNSLRQGSAPNARVPPPAQPVNAVVPQQQMNPQTAPKDNSLQVMNEQIEGINAYHPGEMSSGWSDSYSYLGNSDAIGHSFEFLNESGGYGRGDTVKPTAAMQGGGGGQRQLPPGLTAQPMGKRRGGGDLDARYAMMMESRR